MFQSHLSSSLCQIVRQTPTMVNLMRDIPRSDTQPVQHCRLLLCLFKPFFVLNDLKGQDESWPEAKIRVEQHNLWDTRTKPFRLNIDGMLRQQLAADEDRAKKQRESAAASKAGHTGNDNDGEDEHYVHGGDSDDALGDESVIETTRGRLLTKIFVDEAVDAFVSAGFPRNDTQGNTSSDAGKTRSSQEIQADLDRITNSSGGNAQAYMARQEKEFETLVGSRIATLGDDAPTPSPTPSTTTSGPNHADALEPFIMTLRESLSEGKSQTQIACDTARRDRNNAEAARSAIGALTSSQHVVTQRVADEFGLNSQQRLALYIYANGMFAKQRDPSADSLRMYLGGGAGSGKSHTLKAMKAFSECPALRDLIPQGRFMAIAFQGKMAAAVGGTTAHSVCQAGSKDKVPGSLSKNHEDQQPLTASQSGHWKNAATLVFEEVSMIGCELTLSVNKAAGQMFPVYKHKPFGNLVVVFCGDFNQLKYVIFKPLSLAVHLIKFSTAELRRILPMPYALQILFNRPVLATTLAIGASRRRHNLPVHIKCGADLFRSSINACVMLESSNRFSESYAPLMDRLLHSKCTHADVRLLNTRVLNGKPGLRAKDFYNGRVITFRNKARIRIFT